MSEICIPLFFGKLFLDTGAEALNAGKAALKMTTALGIISSNQPSTDDLKKSVEEFSSCAKSSLDARLASLTVVTILIIALFVIFSIIFIVAFSVSVFYENDARTASFFSLVYIISLIIFYYFVKYKISSTSDYLKRDLRTCSVPVSTALSSFKEKEKEAIKKAICP